jgi:hypothetical protein
MGFIFILLDTSQGLYKLNTLFSARIVGLFGSRFELTSKGFGLIFVNGSL